MLSDKTVRGTHFTCFHAGAKEGWTQFRLGPPDVPINDVGLMDGWLIGRHRGALSLS